MSNRQKLNRCLVTAIVVLTATTVRGQDNSWTELDTGLDIASFKVSRHSPVGDSTFLVVRADPHHVDGVDNDDNQNQGSHLIHGLK